MIARAHIVLCTSFVSVKLVNIHSKAHYLLFALSTEHACRIVRSAFEQILGTIVGGCVGLFVCWTSSFVPDSYLYMTYAATAGSIGAAGIWLSELVPRASTSAQLFVVTFVMVFAEGHSMVRLTCLVAARSCPTQGLWAVACPIK